MPLPVITVAQMREWERAAWASGQTEAEVIRRVGQGIAFRLSAMTRTDDYVVVLAGRGNNGADARSAGEQLAGRTVDVLTVVDPAAKLGELETKLARKPAVVLDGLFGVGLNRPLAPEWVEFIATLNRAGARVVAVDLPSGLNGDTGDDWGEAVRARLTLTVGAPKCGLLAEKAWDRVGRLECVTGIGLGDCPMQSECLWTTADDFRGFPPERSAATHKGSFGHLAIIAGSLGYHGAAALAARGAQRARPGLITLHALESVYPVIAPQFQAVMVSPWEVDTKLPGPWTAVLLGPGLAGRDVPDQMKLLTRLMWRDSALPVIVDASALDWLPIEPTPQHAIRVITPHPGEAGRLLGSTSQKIQAARMQSLRQLSAKFGNCWVVLKGHQTLVGRASGPVFVNSSGNPYLAQGGSGDLLSGYIGGLLAQASAQEDTATALRFAVWQHGAAADELQASRRNWVIEDLADRLGQV